MDANLLRELAREREARQAAGGTKPLRREDSDDVPLLATQEREAQQGAGATMPLRREDSDDVPLLADQSVVRTPGAAAAARPPPPAYDEAIGGVSAGNVQPLQQLILRLMPLGFASEQITAAWSALGGTPSEAAVLGVLLNEDTGSPAHVPSFTRSISRQGSGVSERSLERANAEVQLRAMGFTPVQIRAAAEAVGSHSVRAMTDHLLKGDSATVAPAAPPDPRKALLRDMCRRLPEFDELQVDNALEAVGRAAGAGAPDEQELRQWIQGNVEASMRPSVNMICSKLIELGLAPAEASRKAADAHRLTSTLQGAINHALMPREETVRREDMITGEVLSARDMFICECDCKHMLSYETFFVKILADVRDRCVPACPLNSIPNGCKYVMTQKETEDVIAAVMRNDVLRADLVDEATFRLLELEPDQRLANGQRGFQSQLVSRIYMNRIKTGGGFVECPQEDCGWFVEVQQAGAAEGDHEHAQFQIVCGKCKFQFCSACKKLFHSNTPCDEMLSYARRWAEWLEEGRPQALERLARLDSKFTAALEQFNAQREQHAADMLNRKAQYEQMLADERWKEQHCKRCPHCSFVVNKLDGCDAMVCGRDYHGNVMQGGCGKRFNWVSDAKPYTADTGHHPNVEEFARQRPVDEMPKKRLEADGVTHLLCSVCQEQIQGPHAVCLNCPNWKMGWQGIHQVCLQCQVAPGSYGHLASHVCRVFQEDNFVEVLVRSQANLNALSVKELKEILQSHNVDFSACREKSELVAMVRTVVSGLAA